MPPYDEHNQPHFLFLLTPPFSGSTVVAKILNTSPRTMMLTHRGEGQWLIRGLYEERRWDPEKEINYESVKAVWLNVYQKTAKTNPRVDVVIEKSPSNMMRVEKLTSLFARYSLLANNRDAYANCASILYRRYDGANINAMQRQKVLEELAQRWLVRSYKLRELITKYEIPLLTYEWFCQNPALILEVLDLPPGVTDTIDVNAKVQVKDYPPQPVSNQNERQISRLSDDEIELISRVLAPHRALLDFFNYEIRP